MNIEFTYLSFYIFSFIIIVVGLHTNLQLLQENFFHAVLIYIAVSIGQMWLENSVKVTYFCLYLQYR